MGQHGTLVHQVNTKGPIILVGLELGTTPEPGQAVAACTKAKYILHVDGEELRDDTVITALKPKEVEMYLNFDEPCVIQLWGNHISGPKALGGEIIVAKG